MAAAAIAASAAVISASAASFSEDNIVFVDQGGWMQKWDSNFNVVDSSTHPVVTSRYTFVDLKRAAGNPLSQKKKLVRMNCDYGPGMGDYDGTVNYAHSRFFLALNNNNYNQPANISIALNYYDGSNDGRILEVFRLDNATNSFSADGAETLTTLSRRNEEGDGPWTVRSNAGDWIWHQFDIIVDVNGGKPGMVYGYIDGKLYGYTKVPENRLDADNKKVYHSYTIVADKDSFTKTNDEIMLKLPDDYVRATIYANTDDYTVTLEDVINHQGLSDDISDLPNAIMKTSALESYMPGADSYAYDSISSGSLINPSVTYNEDKTVATIAQNTDDAAEAALMIRGGYPVTGQNGMGYSNYKNTGQWTVFSFDQQIVKGQNIYYGIGNNSYNNCINMWDNNGKLVVHMTGESGYGYGNPTLDGQDGKPDVGYNDKAHIDWLLDHVNKRQYLFVDGKLVTEGDISTGRNNQVFVYTKGDAELNISEWSMTLYNQDAEYEDIRSSIEGAVASGIVWEKGKMTYEITESMEGGGDIAVSVCAKSVGDYEPTDETKVITAIYDEDGNLLDIKLNQFVSEQTLADETVTNVFKYTEDMKTVRTYVWEMTNIIPQVKDYHMDILNE